MRLCAWFIDSLDRHAFESFNTAFKKAANLLQMTTTTLEDFRVALCFVRLPSEISAELDFLLDFEKLHLRKFHSAVDQLKHSENCLDQKKLADALAKVTDRFEKFEENNASNAISIPKIISKEIHVITKALDSGRSLLEFLKSAGSKNIRILFHVFTDPTSNVIILICDKFIFRYLEWRRI